MEYVCCLGHTGWFRSPPVYQHEGTNSLRKWQETPTLCCQDHVGINTLYRDRVNEGVVSRLPLTVGTSVRASANSRTGSLGYIMHEIQETNPYWKKAITSHFLLASSRLCPLPASLMTMSTNFSANSYFSFLTTTSHLLAKISRATSFLL